MAFPEGQKCQVSPSSKTVPVEAFISDLHGNTPLNCVMGGNESSAVIPENN